MTSEAHCRIPSTHQPETVAITIPTATTLSQTLTQSRSDLSSSAPSAGAEHPRRRESGQGFEIRGHLATRLSRNLRLQAHWVTVTPGTFRILLLIWRTSVHHGLQLPATTSRPQILHNTTSCQSTCATSAIGRCSTCLFQASVPPNEQ
jgi:hypothetical protein